MQHVQTIQRSKLGVALGVLFVISGAMKLLGVDMMAAQFEQWGYSIAFRFVIGLVEVAAGVGLMFPMSARWSAIALIAVMAGAIYTHVFRGEWLLAAAVPLFVMILLTIVAVRPHKSVNVDRTTFRRRRTSRDWSLDDLPKPRRHARG